MEAKIEPLVVETTSPLERKRPPSLTFTEGLYHEAHRRLESAMEANPDMTGDEAEALLASIIPPIAVKTNRDAFARFVLEAERIADAKRQIAAAYTDQAKRIDRTVGRITEAVVKSMREGNVFKLAGDEHVLNLKRNPPSVVVDDERAVPEGFIRFTESKDSARLAALCHEITRAGELSGRALADAVALLMETSADLLAESMAERRAVDKAAVKAAWKEAGGEDDSPCAPGCRIERKFTLEIR